MGLSMISALNVPLTSDIGYTMGVRYIHKFIPNSTNMVKSLYLVVSDDTMMPTPNPNTAVCNISSGIIKTDILRCGEYPLHAYIIIAIIDIANIIIMLIAENITDDMDIVSLGKYTLPIIPALLTKVDDVALTQDEK